MTSDLSHLVIGQVEQLSDGCAALDAKQGIENEFLVAFCKAIEPALDFGDNLAQREHKPIRVPNLDPKTVERSDRIFGTARSKVVKLRRRAGADDAHPAQRLG